MNRECRHEDSAPVEGVKLVLDLLLMIPSGELPEPCGFVSVMNSGRSMGMV